MRGATEFATQWAGIVAFVRLQGEHVPGATLMEEDSAHDGDSVAMAYDIGPDTAVWFIATLPHAQRKGLAASLLRRLLLDARERGQRTASLQASPAGRPLYERLGFGTVGSLHLHEQRFPQS